jgi:hypothetical protein
MNKQLARLYYDPSNPSAFSALAKLQADARKAKGKQPSPRAKQNWLHQQDAYTLHKPVRKRFSRNPYSVNNVMDVWESDLLDVQNLSRYNNYKFLLTVTDVFSKFLNVISLKNKTGPTVTSAFQSIFQDTNYDKPYKQSPIVLRTDKGKEFLNETFQDMLKSEDIEFQICKHPDVKCAVIERAQRTIREKLYKYFTYKNSYRFIDALPKFITGYNATLHSTTGMAPSEVTDRDILLIWKRMRWKRRHIGLLNLHFAWGNMLE